MTTGWTGCTDQTLKLKCMDNVLMPLVTPFPLLFDWNEVVSGCNVITSYSIHYTKLYDLVETLGSPLDGLFVADIFSGAIRLAQSWKSYPVL